MLEDVVDDHILADVQGQSYFADSQNDSDLMQNILISNCRPFIWVETLQTIFTLFSEIRKNNEWDKTK